jgi:NDP-sugar pyrophosphorylase family protein
MKIIIPMTGYGSRFVAAGYKELKPFIKVLGRPIIDWIVSDMYPPDTKFLFICREEHIERKFQDRDKTYGSYLHEISPGSEIFTIEDWVKKGPVNDVYVAKELINDDEQCIVNYCDFFIVWDYYKFIANLKIKKPDGAIICYTGFHPSLLPEKNVYASCQIDSNDYLLKIREKYTFGDKLKAYHSCGAYYFKSGAVLKKYHEVMLKSGHQINDEYYTSLVYNYLIEDDLKVWCACNADFMGQFGTPEDLQEFEFYNSCKACNSL